MQTSTPTNFTVACHDFHLEESYMCRRDFFLLMGLRTFWYGKHFVPIAEWVWFFLILKNNLVDWKDIHIKSLNPKQVLSYFKASQNHFFHSQLTTFLLNLSTTLLYNIYTHRLSIFSSDWWSDARVWETLCLTVT